MEEVSFYELRLFSAQKFKPYHEATSLQINTGVDILPGYGYLWWLPSEEGYLAIGFGGQFIAVFPERNLVVGTHSNINSTELYQQQLFHYISDNIASLFENNN